MDQQQGTHDQYKRPLHTNFSLDEEKLMLYT